LLGDSLSRVAKRRKVHGARKCRTVREVLSIFKDPPPAEDQNNAPATDAAPAEAEAVEVGLFQDDDFLDDDALDAILAEHGFGNEDEEKKFQEPPLEDLELFKYFDRNAENLCNLWRCVQTRARQQAGEDGDVERVENYVNVNDWTVEELLNQSDDEDFEV
jgi:hypothetical protein